MSITMNVHDVTQILREDSTLVGSEGQKWPVSKLTIKQIIDGVSTELVITCFIKEINNGNT